MSNSPQKVYLDIKIETIFKLSFIVLIMLAMWRIRNILVVILTSVVIASFVEGAVQRFNVKGLGRSLKVIIVYLSLILLFGGVLYLMLPTFIREIAGLFSLVPDGSPLRAILSSITSIGQVQEGNPGLIAEQLQTAYQTFSNNFLDAASSLFGGILNIILILIISFYLSIQEKGIENFLKIITPVHHEKKVLAIWYKIQKKIGLWFQGQLVMALIVGILTYIGLLIIGAPYKLILALLAGVFELIPFGLVFATIPAVVLAFKAGGLSLSFFTLVVFIVIQQLENYLLQPQIVQRTTGVPSLVVLLSVLIGISLFGVYGLFLGIPFAVLILELINDYEVSKIKQENN